MSARGNPSNLALPHSSTSSVAHIAPKTTTAKETTLIKLHKVKEVQGNDKPATSEDESKITQSASASQNTITSARGSQPKGNESKETESVAEIFKQRIIQWRRSISKGMVFSDQLEMRDPQMVAEFATDIYINMRKTEQNLKIDADYLSKTQIPSEVKDTSRAFLIEWIIDVHRKFRLVPETLYVTVFIIDRFLSLK